MSQKGRSVENETSKIRVISMESNENVQVIPPLTEDDRDWLRDLWLSEWGGETMISKGKTHHFHGLDAFIALSDGVRVGAATYNFETDECELMSINS